MISLIRNRSIIISFSFLLLLLLSCNNKKTDSGSLVVTIDPQRYFLEQIVKDRYKVVSLIPNGANPESFDPTPSQLITLSKSKAYFKIGFMGIENTLVEKVKEQHNLNIINCSTGIDIIQEEDHHHDHSSHNHNHNHQHHAHAGGDPHYWNSISSAKIILKNMLDAVIGLDPQNASEYTDNYNKELSRINETDSIINAYLSKSESKTFIIYHPALSYFAREYNLTQLSIEHEGKSPSPSQLKQLIDEAKEKNVRAVFIQQEFDVKNAEIIAKEIGIGVDPINLLEYNWHEEMIKIAKNIAGEQ